MNSMEMPGDRWSARRVAGRFGGRGGRGGRDERCAAFAENAHDAHGAHSRGRRGHRPGPRGFGPDSGPGFDRGFGPGFGPGPRGRRGRRARGDTRLAVLTLLAEQPRHGYEIIQEISERTGGAWRPSPGSVYPTLQQLEDEGLVRTEEADGRRTVRLTETGQAYVEQHSEELARVWDVTGDEISESVANLRTQYGQLHAAVLQIVSTGTDAQRAAAANALAEARKTIYRLLAED
jgi:DNA-binding PadR family transcriptional regulator